MHLLRTPDDRFDGLADWPFEPHYTHVQVEGVDVRIAHAEAGSGSPVLLMHGEPTWSYLYRHFLPPIAAAGHRAIAPDLVGFGRSDKPDARADYTYARHVAWMSAWLEANDLRDITLFCQDWGGLIGLRLVAAYPDRFRAVVAGNTFLPTGDGTASDGFLAWRRFSQEVPVFDVGRIVDGGTGRALTDAERAAYDAPFPDETFKEGARQFPVLVPTSPDDPEAPANRAAWGVLSAWDKPFVCAFSDSDPVTAGSEKGFMSRVPGTAGQPHRTIHGARHFLQEDAPQEVVEVILAVARGAVSAV